MPQVLHSASIPQNVLFSQSVAFDSVLCYMRQYTGAGESVVCKPFHKQFIMPFSSSAAIVSTWLLQPNLWQWLRITRHTDASKLNVHNFRGSKRIKFFKPTKLCLAVWKVAEGVLLCGLVVMLWLIRFHCAGIQISTGLPCVYLCIWQYVYSVLLLQNLMCIKPSRA
jgi:hypothetical protein